MEKAARVLNKDNDEKKYNLLFEKIKKSFNNNCVSSVSFVTALLTFLKNFNIRLTFGFINDILIRVNSEI